MIRWIRIFVWLRIRTLINTAKSGARRDTVSRLSRFAEAAAPILLAVFLIPLATPGPAQHPDRHESC